MSEKLIELVNELRKDRDAADAVHKSEIENLKVELKATREDLARKSAPASSSDEGDYTEKAFADLIVNGANAIEGGKIKATDYAISVSADGGIAVPTSIHSDVVEKLRKASPILGLSTVTSLKGHQKLLLKTSKTDAKTRSERGAFADNTVDGFAGITMTSMDVYDRQAHTVESVEGDSVVDFKSMLMNDITSGLAEKTAELLLRSTAKNAVENGGALTEIQAGILNRATEAMATPDRFAGELGKTHCLTTAGVNSVTFDDLVKLYSSLHTKFRNKASFVLGSDIELQLMLIKDADGHYIWEPSVNQTYQATLFGRPVYIDDFMPGLTGDAGKPRVLFADFSENYVNYSGPMQWIVDPYTAPGYVKYTARQRFGSVFRDAQAIRGLNLKTA